LRGPPSHPGYSTPEGETKREAVNERIRTKGEKGTGLSLLLVSSIVPNIATDCIFGAVCTPAVAEHVFQFSCLWTGAKQTSLARKKPVNAPAIPLDPLMDSLKN